MADITRIFLIYCRYYYIMKNIDWNQKNNEVFAELTAIVLKEMPNHLYHNPKHALGVFEASMRYAKMEGLDREQTHLLGIGALLHDIVYVQDAKDNEEKSAEYASKYMLEKGYEAIPIEKVKGMILSTKFPQKPNTLAERIICDADLDNLGTDEFFDIGEKLRMEWRYKNEEWLSMQKKLLESHQYFTESAKHLRQKKKEENLRMLSEKYRIVSV